MTKCGYWGEYFLRLAWVRFKAALGIPITADKNFLAADAAWRLKTGRLPKGVAITCVGRVDGIGMQAMSRISGLNFAATFGATYVHVPFERIDHNKRNSPQWVRDWEEFFGLGRGEVTVADGNFEIVDYADYFFGRRRIYPDTVLKLQQCFWFHRKDADSFRLILPRLREKYGRLAPRSDKSRLTVAVHVRRGDVTPARNRSRYTTDGVILGAIGCLRQGLDKGGYAYRIHLYSQGEEQEFRAFREAGCELHLNEDDLATMRQLIESDVLLMSKSSFCYVAALINNGVKIYESAMNGPMSDWIVRRQDGSFDKAELVRKLANIDVCIRREAGDEQGDSTPTPSELPTATGAAVP